MNKLFLRNKNEDEKVLIVPYDLLDREDMSGQEKLCLIVMLRLAQEEAVTAKEIAWRIKASEEEVKKIWFSLEEKGILERLVDDLDKVEEFTFTSFEEEAPSRQKMVNKAYQTPAKSLDVEGLRKLLGVPINERQGSIILNVAKGDQALILRVYELVKGSNDLVEDMIYELQLATSKKKKRNQVDLDRIEEMKNHEK